MPEYSKVMIRRSCVPRRVINVPQVCGRRKAEFDRRDPRLDKAWCGVSTPDAQIKGPNWYNDLNILKALVGSERRSPAPRRYMTLYPKIAGAVYGVHMVGKRKDNHDRRCSHPKGFHSFTLPDFRIERRGPGSKFRAYANSRDPRIQALERRKV